MSKKWNRDHVSVEVCKATLFPYVWRSRLDNLYNIDIVWCAISSWYYPSYVFFAASDHLSVNFALYLDYEVALNVAIFTEHSIKICLKHIGSLENWCHSEVMTSFTIKLNLWFDTENNSNWEKSQFWFNRSTLSLYRLKSKTGKLTGERWDLLRQVILPMTSQYEGQIDLISLSC